MQRRDIKFYSVWVGSKLWGKTSSFQTNATDNVVGTCRYLFFVLRPKCPTNNFDIASHVRFVVSDTRSSSHVRLIHTRLYSNKLGHYYFSLLPRLWNCLQPLDLSSSLHSLQHELKDQFWLQFVSKFNSDNSYSFCPCHKCTSIPVSTNFSK